MENSHVMDEQMDDILGFLLPKYPALREKRKNRQCNVPQKNVKQASKAKQQVNQLQQWQIGISTQKNQKLVHKILSKVPNE